MGILSRIARRKESFRKTKEAVHKLQTDVAIGRMERQQKANLREAELLQAKQNLAESQQIKQDLRTAQGPTKMQKFGQGLARTIEKGRASHAKRQAMKVKVGAPKSTGSVGLKTGSRDVFSTGSDNVFGIGGSKQQTDMPKKPAKRPRVIVEL